MVRHKSCVAALRQKFLTWANNASAVPAVPLDLQVLEERVLYSATPLPIQGLENVDPAGTINGSLEQLENALQASETGYFSSQNDLSPAALPLRAAIFVDESLTNLEQLIAGLQLDHEFDLFMIGRDSEGIAGINSALASSEYIYTSMHILTHGGEATLQFGETVVTADNIGLYQSQFEGWANHLSADADILFYGCDVAATADGQELLTRISVWSGADIAASDDLTGHIQLGGDWALEYRIGDISTQVIVGAYGQSQWSELLNLSPTGGETLVNEGTVNNQATTPNGGGNVAMDGNGNYAVVWQDNRSGDYDIWARVFNSDGSVKIAEFKVHSNQTSNQEWAQVAMSADGKFAVTWSDNRSGTYESYMRLFDATGTAMTGDTLVSSMSGAQDYHALDFAADGSFVVAFQSANDSDIYFQRYDASGIAQGANVKVNSYTTDIQNVPDIAVADDGKFIVVWESNAEDGSGYGIYGQRFDAAGTTLGTAFKVNSTTAGNQWLPSVAAASDGSFVVSWESDLQDGSGFGIYAQRYNSAGVAQGGEIQVNSHTPGDQGSSHIDLRRDGNFIVTWRSSAQDGAGWGVYAQQFDAAGNRLGNETLVNSTTSGSQTDPSVAYAGNQAVVVWSGEGVGDTNGVFAQRFDTNSAPVLNASQSPTLTAQLEDAGPPAGTVGTLVSSLVDFATPTGQVDNVTDSDAYAALGIAVTAANNTNGTYWYSVDGGSTWQALGSVSNTSARLLAADASTRIYFQPNANYNGTMASAITFRAWDQTSGQNGLLADTSTNGGSTAFSTDTDTAALTITAVNDAPVLDPNGTMTFTTITEDQTSNSGDTVAAVIASAGGDRITDVDSGALEGIAIYNLSNSNGTWQYNIGSGWTAVGSVSFSQSLLLRDTDSLRFVPNGVTGGSQFISFAAWDQTSGTAGTKADTNLYGGTTAFSVALETAVLTVTNINDAPSGANKTVTTLENTNYVFASSDFGFSDIDGNSLAAVVISSLPAAGTLYIDADGDGWVDAGETLAASSIVSLADITANRLKFRPTGSENGIGYASFNFAVRDNGGTANGGQDTDQSPNTLTINVTPTYAISGTVFEDINYGGGAGRDFVTAAAAAPSFDIDAEGVTVELYNASGTYVASTVTDINGVYAFAVVDGTYTVRIVNSTVLSNRAGATSALIGVQTFRTDAASGAAIGVTDHVGGQRPEEIDALANNGSQTFSVLNNAAGRELQSVTTVLVSAVDVSGIDFGFNFDTIVNTNDSGQGSLRQFILNSNALGNTALAQAGQAAGDEVSLFMIADGQTHAGLNAGYNNLLTGTLGVDARAIITLASALPTVTAANTVLDASTQTLLVGNSNPGSVGAGGAASMTVGVGVDGIAGTADDQILNAFDRPEVEIRGNGITASLLQVTGANFTFEGFAVWGNGGNATSTLSIVSGSGHLIQHNLFGADALGVAQAHTVTAQNQFVNLASGVTGATVFHNYVTAASQAGSTLGIYPNIDSSNVVLDSNEFSGAISWGTALYAHNATATRNYFHNLASQSLTTFYGPFANQVIEHNTFADNLNGINLQGTGSGAVRYNLIQGNTSSAITLTTANSNVDISKNSIYGNGGVGISVSGAGSNDGALTSGANHGMDFPVLTHANLVGNTLTLAGYVGSAPNQAAFGGARVEFFVASATGSGQTYLGSLTTDANGNFSGSLAVSGLDDTQRITATATLASAGTSQFAAAWGVNGTPTDVTPNSFNVDENTDTSSGYAVGTLTTTDPDSGEGFTYTVVGGADAAKFSISGNQLILTDGVLDFETQPSYSVQIRTTDAQGLWYEETLTIIVNNIDEAPMVIVSSEVDDASNQVVDFQGGDDSISLTGLPVNTASGTEVTVEFWMKWDGTNSVMPFGFESYDLWLNDGYIGFNSANGDLYGVSSSGLASGWHHIAAIFHNGDVTGSRLLIDGVEQALAQQLGTPNDSNAFVDSSANISGWTANASYRFDGQMDQVRIWNGARSETQIRTEMFRELAGPHTGLVAAYSFTGASTGTGGVVDDSGNGNHGTMVGMTLANVVSAAGFNQLGDHTVNEDEVVRLQVAAFDPENQALTYSWSQTVGPAVNLSNAAAASPTFTAPNQLASYQLEFSVTVSDGTNTSTEHLTISVTAVNDAPEAVADVATAVEASGVGNAVAGTNPTGNVLTNDSDVDAGDTITVVGVAAGVQGSSLGSVGVSLSGSYGAIVINTDGSYSYTVDNDNPAVEALNAGETLSDTFTYTISDAGGAQSTTQIVITIDGRTDQPVATADTATAIEAGGVSNSASGTNPSGNVLDNDESGNGKTVSGVAAGSTGSAAGNVSAVVSGLYGTVVIDADGSYSYTLDNSNAAVEALRTSSDQLTDVFTYSMKDSFDNVSSTELTITITGQNDDQVIAVNTGLTVAENSTGNPLTASALSTTDVDNSPGQMLYTLTAPTGNGTLRLSGVALTTGATFTQADIDAGRISYDHDGSESASDSFAFTVDDASGAASNGTFSIAISPVNDQTPVITSNGGGATATLLVNENITTVTQVTATDGDLPAPTLIYSIEGGADRALFAIDATTGALQFITARDRELAADADGDHNYEVIVQASDGALFSRQSIHVVIGDVDEYDVTAPIDSNATANFIQENSAMNTPVGLVARAVDADATNNTVTYSLDIDDQGRFAINATTGEVRLVRGVDYEMDGPSRSIRIRASSSDGSSSTKDYTIAIGDVNEAPIARSDAYSTSYIDDLIVNMPGVAGNDSDPDGNTIAVVLVQGPATGTARLLSNGSLLYHPQPGFIGTVQLIYYVTDGTLNSAHATVTIQVTQPTNVPPPVESVGKDAGGTSPPKPATNESGPVPVKPSPVLVNETAVAEVAVASSAATLEAKQGRTLQPSETVNSVTTETTVLFNPMRASNLLEQDISRMQLSESNRLLVRQTQSNQVVYAEVKEHLEEEIVQDWVSQIDPYVATAVGTGIVIWLVHAGQFAAALLSTASTWVHIDPLTVLEGAQDIDLPETCEEKLFDGQDELRPAGRDR